MYIPRSNTPRHIIYIYTYMSIPRSNTPSASAGLVTTRSVTPATCELMADGGSWLTFYVEAKGLVVPDPQFVPWQPAPSTSPRRRNQEVVHFLHINLHVLRPHLQQPEYCTHCALTYQPNGAGSRRILQRKLVEDLLIPPHPSARTGAAAGIPGSSAA